MSLKYLDKGEKAKFDLGYGSPVNIISESGLYKLIMRSNKPEAKAFQNWVTGEVLPTIRKTGSYNPQQGKQEQVGQQAQPQLSLEDMAKVVDGYDYALSCHCLAATTASSVAKSVFQMLMQEPDTDIHHARFMLTLTAGHGKAADVARLQKIPDDAFVTTLENVSEHIADRVAPPLKELAKIAAVCNQKLARSIA